MSDQTYLQWLSATDEWWNDSALPVEIEAARVNGATGVTTNPVLAARAAGNGLYDPSPSEVETAGGKAEARLRHVVLDALAAIGPVRGAGGFVCAQVEPALDSDREAMLTTARRFHSWSPRIAVKLPTCAAGLDVLEECAAEGIPTTMTTSFCVSQLVAASQRHLAGCARAERVGIEPAPSWAVLMIGRLDDYLRDIAADNDVDLSAADLQRAGIAVAKRAAALFTEIGARSRIMVAALRGPHHVAELTGGGIVFTLSPKMQQALLAAEPARITKLYEPEEAALLKRLRRLPEFVRVYEPEGMTPEQMYAFGPFQRTQTQFHISGWANLAG